MPFFEITAQQVAAKFQDLVVDPAQLHCHLLESHSSIKALKIMLRGFCELRNWRWRS
jgi:hypothetical protein